MILVTRFCPWNKKQNNAFDMKISAMMRFRPSVLFITHPQPDAFDSLRSAHKSPKHLHLPWLKHEAGLHNREV